MLVVAATVIAASFRESIRGDLDRSIAAELVIEAGDGFLGGVDPALTAQLENLDSVDAFSTVRPVQAELDGDPVSVAGVHANQLEQVLNLTTTQGSLAELTGTGIGLSNSEAESRNLDIGDSVVLSTQLTKITLDVVALYTPDEVVGGMIVDVSVADRIGFQPLDSLVLVSTTDTAVSQPGIEAILAGDPTATVKTARAYADDQAGELNTLLNLLYGLLALSVIIALLGVANTMTLSIHERTRELGLLRAVGMSGPQLRSAVRAEAALIGLVGSMIGLILGIFFGWLGHRATIDTFPVFSLPWIQLLVIAIVGILAGLLAGWRPARRASELNILEAISHS
jgi:putative ABC transport system permease protein